MMITLVFLAHLVGDYILQWNSLAAWKSREQKGVLFHCLIVWATAASFILPVVPGWWPWVLFIGLAHTAIDVSNLWLTQRIVRLRQGGWVLARFLVDQVLHVVVMLIALQASGYLAWSTLLSDVQLALRHEPLLAYALGYTFVLMPAWVVVKLLAYGLVEGAAPDFGAGPDKYVGIMERLLITTFVIMGQYLLIPVVTLPRLLFEGRDAAAKGRSNLYLAELLASVLLALVVGLALRQVRG